jgi:hypothetical protein
MPETETVEKKTLKILLSDRAPVTIVREAWPVVASARWFEGQHESQANRRSRISVRQHADGRRIIYGWYVSKWAVDREISSGYLADEATLIETIRKVADELGRPELGIECIQDLPEEDLS